MAKAIHGRIRDPTADRALGRCFRQKLPQPQIPMELILREIMDVDRTVWKVWLVHTHDSRSSPELWFQWKRQYPEIPTFVGFLKIFHIIYKEVKIVRR